MVLALWFDTDARRTGSHGHTAVQVSPKGVAVTLRASSPAMLVLVVCLVIRLKSNLSKMGKKKWFVSGWIQLPTDQTQTSPSLNGHCSFLSTAFYLGWSATQPPARHPPPNPVKLVQLIV